MEREDYVFTSHLFQSSLTSKIIWTIRQKLRFIFGTISSELISCSGIFSCIQSAIAHHIYLLCKYNKSRLKSCGKRDLSTAKIAPWSFKQLITLAPHLSFAIQKQLPVRSMSSKLTHYLALEPLYRLRVVDFCLFLKSCDHVCGECVWVTNWAGGCPQSNLTYYWIHLHVYDFVLKDLS